MLLKDREETMDRLGVLNGWRWDYNFKLDGQNESHWEEDKGRLEGGKEVDYVDIILKTCIINSFLNSWILYSN